MSQLSFPLEIERVELAGPSVRVRPAAGGACEDTSVASDGGPKSVELYAGGGGMALGLQRAGFHHAALVEWDSKACDTLRLNAHGRWSTADVWDGDVREWLAHSRARDIDEVAVLAGGPPCQPFSLAGRHNGDLDERNMFPVSLDAVREFQPMAVVFENVPGLTRQSFKPYFDYVAGQLREPTVTLRRHESWQDHAGRLARPRRGPRSLSYVVPEPRILNAADFGIPQTRRRVFMIGIREDLGLAWDWVTVEPTHSEQALIYDQWVEPTYWEEHGLAEHQRPKRLSDELLYRLKLDGRPLVARWRTVRDMLKTPTELPDPVDGIPHRSIPNHIGIPGARSYPGHTGSFIDLPAKTIKAGVHGVCGGEAMIRFEDDSLRYLTVRESARLQGFPDDYVFAGPRSHAMRQIGNAVAVCLAEDIGRRLRSLLSI